MEQNWYQGLSSQETYLLESLREAQRNSGGMEPISIKAPDEHPSIIPATNDQVPWEEGDFWKTYQDKPDVQQDEAQLIETVDEAPVKESFVKGVRN